MYWSCCFSSFALLLPSRVVYCPTRFNLTSMFEYSSFFCFMCWAFPRLICPPTSWFRVGRELCRKWWVRTPAGPTLAIFLFFSLSMRKRCPRWDEGDKLQVLFHGTSHCCDILLLLYCGFIFFFMLILYCVVLSLVALYNVRKSWNHRLLKREITYHYVLLSYSSPGCYRDSGMLRMLNG